MDVSIVEAMLGRREPVLDFGCGSGDWVRAFVARDYDAYGCDFESELDPDGERLRLIEEPYRLPFDDDSFEQVMSDQVLEHVQDHDLAFREIARVLRPGGYSLHFYPPRWKPIEPHAQVPLASVIQTRSWLSLWARLGIRNQFQRGLSSEETTERNHRFLVQETNYLPRKELLRIARRHFTEADYGEASYLAARVHPAASIGSRLYSGLRGRVLLTRL